MDLNTLVAAQNEDPKAFQKIVETHLDFAYAVAFRMTGIREEAEDIVQEAFIRLWKNMHKYRPEIKIGTWLYTIITRLCLDYFKSSRYKKMTAEIALEKVNREMGTRDPEMELESKEMITLIHKLSIQLTPTQHAVFVLRDLEGLEVEEIQKILSVTPGNIKSNLHRARKKIKEELIKIYGELKL